MRNIKLPLFGALVAGMGGHFGTVMPGAAADGTDDYVLIVATVDHEIEGAEWGPYGTKIPGADSRTDGRSNTDAMAAAKLPAALQVKALQCEGHSDYYIPSPAEMRALEAAVPKLFAPEAYWTSAQWSAHHAWCQDFRHGRSAGGNKDAVLRVRPVRRQSLQAFITSTL